MPRRKTQLINDEFYHIVKRSVEERKIFLDNEDRFRFVNGLLVFNDKRPTPWDSRAFWHQRDPDSLTKSYRLKHPLVEIHTFTLMPNHFHLLVRQLTDNGIATLMNKIGGYSYYFNKKYGRVGTLFQDRYKVKAIKTDIQLRNTFVYIHNNAIGLIEPRWKEWQVENFQKAVHFLENKYRWSSYWDYIGKSNFPQVTFRDFFLEVFGGIEKIKQEINSWIQFKNEIFKDKERLKEIPFE